MADNVLKFDVGLMNDITSWENYMNAKGGYYPCGPLCTLIPDDFHKHVSSHVLKSYLADNHDQANVLDKLFFPADIPVITKKYTTGIPKQIVANLTNIGKRAVEEIHPWVLGVLVDWCEFDKIICTCPVTSAFNDQDTLLHVSEHEDTSQDTFTAGEVESSADGKMAVHTSMPGASSSVSASNDIQDMQKSQDTRQVTAASGKVESSVDGNCERKAAVHASVPGASASDNDVNNNNTWNRSSVLLLIKLHTEKESLFTKVGVKKKSVWDKIADEMKHSGFHFNYKQVEQKWKNLTKSYRDTVDHNSRSGNDRKECPYFAELEEVYGYRPNVNPLYLISSETQEKDENECSTQDEKEQINIKSSIPEGTERKKLKRSATSSNDEVLNLMKEMHQSMKEDRENQAKQHKETLEVEEKKLKLLNKLIDKISK